MITKKQIFTLAKKNKVSETVIFREYIQLFFLSQLYALKGSDKIFFKGGTALHFIYKAPRFSEDLDFSVNMEEKHFYEIIRDLFKQISKLEPVNFKERKSTAGKKFLLTVSASVLPYETFVSLDFSFREKVLRPQKSIIDTEYPILFTSYVYHLSKEEILAEKIRAILTRTQGRDLYDLWYLIAQGTEIDVNLVRRKLKYYGLEDVNKEMILKKVENFPEKDFVLDMRPLLPANQREKLKDFFGYLKEFLNEKLML